MIILQLNTATGEDTIEASLLEDGAVLREQTLSCDGADAQHVVEGVHALIGDATLDGAVLIQGAERFTVSRVGGVITNALSLSLGMPIISSDDVLTWEQITEELDKSAAPVNIAYSKPPTIG